MVAVVVVVVVVVGEEEEEVTAVEEEEEGKRQQDSCLLCALGLDSACPLHQLHQYHLGHNQTRRCTHRTLLQ